MQLIALLIVLLSVPCSALLAGKILDAVSETKSNIFTRLSFPLASVVALHSPIFPEVLARALDLSETTELMTLILRCISAAGIFSGVVASLLCLFVLIAELPFRWGAEKYLPSISAFRPGALLLLLSLSFYLIVDWAELFFFGYIYG